MMKLAPEQLFIQSKKGTSPMNVAVAEDTIVVIHFPSKGKKLAPGNAKVQHKNSKKKVKQTSLPDTRWSGISMAHGTDRNLNLNSIFQLNSVDNRVVRAKKGKQKTSEEQNAGAVITAVVSFFVMGGLLLLLLMAAFFVFAW